MVDPSQLTQQSDTEMIAVPKELASFIQEVVNLYNHYDKQNYDKQNLVVESLKNLIYAAKVDIDNSLLDTQIKDHIKDDTLRSYSSGWQTEQKDDFLKSWDDIFNVQVYIDTDIYGELDARPPALKELDSSSVDSETVIQHTQATEAYVQSWKELAQSMDSLPDDLFTRLWTTIEIAKVLECSPSSLRQSRRSGRLPIQIKNMILDCISHDGKRSLWFVRPA